MIEEEKKNPLHKILEYWPILAALAAMIVSGIAEVVNIQSDVKDLKTSELHYKEGAEERRERLRSELEDIRTRLTKLEEIHELEINELDRRKTR